MTLSRRGFLTRSGLALGALVVGDEVLETLARLTHVRKIFPGAGLPSVSWRPLNSSTPTIPVDLSRYARLEVVVKEGGREGGFEYEWQGSQDGRTGWLRMEGTTAQWLPNDSAVSVLFDAPYQAENRILR